MALYNKIVLKTEIEGLVIIYWGGGAGTNEGGHVQIILTLPFYETHFLLTQPPPLNHFLSLPNMHE